MNVEELSNTHILKAKPDLAERFEVLDVLGEGAAGAVYRVRDKQKNNIEVALKVLLNNTAFDENTLDRFMGELRICREVHHPNVVEAYDLIHLGDTIAFTMQFVKGADLGKVFRQRRLSFTEVEQYFTSILSGLQALHDHDVVHRDLKLENVLIGEDGTVKLSDLGLMKWGEFESMTKTGILLGTAQYMPPEYVRNSVYDHRGDIYAVGLMLYEVLTGKRRLNEKSGNEALEYLIRTKFELPRITLTGLPPKYLRIIDRATAQDPADRYQSASEMLEALVSEQRPDEGSAAERQEREAETRRFCEKSALSSAMDNSSNFRPKIYRNLMLVLTFVALMLMVPYLFKLFEQNQSLSLGYYEGQLELYGGTGYKKSMSLDVKSEGVWFTSAFDYCRSGKVDLGSGNILCGKEGVRIKIGSSSTKQIKGEIIDLGMKERHTFSLVRQARK